MNNFEFNLLFSAIIAVILLTIKIFINYFLRKYSKDLNFSFSRRKTISKFTTILLYILFFLILGLIWNIKKDEFFLYLSSILAVLGVAMFAQWSILSNITAGIILFFSHPLKIGDQIKIYDKDFPIEGQVRDITGFFIYIRTPEGTEISLPNSVVLQKGISILKESNP